MRESHTLIVGMAMFFGGIFFWSLWFGAIWRALKNTNDNVLRGEREQFKYANPSA